jgi:hypothetical protein
MSVFTEVGNAESRATLAEAMAIGVSFTFTHRDNPSVTLYGLVLDQSLASEYNGRGRLKEIGIIRLRIPVQTGFAVMTDNQRPVTKGDTIEYPIGSGRLFNVKGDEDIAQRANGYEYDVKFREDKTLTAGVTS